MSRSRKKAIFKDRDRSQKPSTSYWRRIRRVIKNKIKSYPWAVHNQTMDDERYEYNSDWDMSLIKEMPEDIPDLEDTLPDPKAIVNDYEYRDYIWDHEYNSRAHHPEYQKLFDKCTIKYRRK